MSVRSICAAGATAALLAGLATAGSHGFGANAGQKGVLNEHLELLDRNAAAFVQKDRAALEKDLAADYSRVTVLGKTESRKQELAALARLLERSTHLSEMSQATRLTVRGGDATNPTVATTLVQTHRTADVTGADGRLHAMSWDSVANEERTLTPGGWICRRRVELKDAVQIDGAPYRPGETSETRAAREELQLAYAEMARAADAPARERLRAILDPDFAATGLDGKAISADEFTGNFVKLRQEAWKSETEYQVTDLTRSGTIAIAAVVRTVVRLAPDKEGIYRTTREQTSLRDTWEKSQRGWRLKKSEALLAEVGTISPLRPAGWE